ncbi:LPXTG cell wall anchor domain-containing protein [Asanoa sp. NPDC049518]|uniref:LPXTG cell wall anchor domain-containing protein n=1 Tax=unclassified Asanoa TaxID=2685164 RepID=UPI00343B9826
MSRRVTVMSVATLLTGGAAALALASPAAAQMDPPGANGDVKIDGFPYAEANSNEPHVSCQFRVEFFNFDKDEHADIILSTQPPSGKFVEIERLTNVLVSDDAATGGSVKRDPDAYFEFSADDLALDVAEPHPQQGYHIKLTVDRRNHPEWTEKHKVFWLGPCTTTPSPGNGDGGGGGNGDGGGGGSGDAEGGSLPRTGPAVGAMLAAGTALVGGGAGLLLVRRRRARFES